MHASSFDPETAEPCDVLVVGGGPAGSTMAALLAADGRDVVLVEKARHPRFHVGESLLPANGPLFDRLGVREAVDRLGMPKFGIEFLSPDHAHKSYFEFADAWDKTMPRAWQVRRSEFDEVLFRHAASRGARTLEGCRVQDVAFDAEGATVSAEVTGEDGRRTPRRWRARYVVDASGRDTLLASRLGLKKRNPAHNSSALFAHFTGARRLEGSREGNISICWFDHGWFWFIPLANGTTSVGAVCWPYYLKSRDKPLREFFFDTVAMCPELADRLQHAQLVDDAVHATGNYCYGAVRATGERFVLLGDAFTFIDPMFSTGVYLAMQNAFDAVALVDAALDRPAESAAVRRAFEKRMRFGPDLYSWIVYRATNAAIRHLFMYPNNPWRVKEALLSLLAGDIYGATPIWGSLRMFRVIYYSISLRHPLRTLSGMWRRRGNIRDTGPLRGETVARADG
jgi:flavin-dependent dehydrogenase